MWKKCQFSKKKTRGKDNGLLKAVFNKSEEEEATIEVADDDGEQQMIEVRYMNEIKRLDNRKKQCEKKFCLNKKHFDIKKNG